MFNPLPILALGLVAIGYTAAIDQTDREFDRLDTSALAAFPAGSDLSVQDFVGALPDSLQDPQCDAAGVITSGLSKDFEESQRDSWMVAADRQMQLWASDLMGTWTLLQIGQDDMACIVASGFGWTPGMDAKDILVATPLAS